MNRFGFPESPEASWASPGNRRNYLMQKKHRYPGKSIGKILTDDQYSESAKLTCEPMWNHRKSTAQRFTCNTSTGSLYDDHDSSSTTYNPIEVALLGASTPLAFTDFVLTA